MASSMSDVPPEGFRATVDPDGTSDPSDDSATWTLDLDPGIRFAVRVLLAAGVETNQSCQGGEGHCAPEPFVDFDGGPYEGFHAFNAVMNEGLPVLRLDRMWTLSNGELTGPLWRLIFRRPSLEWADRHPSFQRIAIPLNEDGTWPGEPAKTLAFRLARDQRAVADGD